MHKSITVADCMARHPLTFRAETDLLLAIEQLLKHRISAAPVVDEHGYLLGVVSDGDCLRAILAATYHDSAAGTVAGYMTVKVDTVTPHAGLSEIAGLFLNNSRHCLPVLENSRLVGLVSRHDALRGLKAVAQHAAKLT